MTVVAHTDTQRVVIDFIWGVKHSTAPCQFNDTLVIFLLYLKQYYWFTATFERVHGTYQYFLPNNTHIGKL